MLLLAIVCLPCLLCLVSLILYALRERKDYTQQVFTFLFLLGTVYFFTSATLEVAYFNKTLVDADDLVFQYFAPLLVASLYLYLRTLYQKRMFTYSSIGLALPGIFIGTGNLFIHIVRDNATAEYVQTAEAIHRYWMDFAFRPVLAIMIIIVLVTMVRSLVSSGFSFRKYADFWLHGGEETLPHIQTFSLFFVLIGSSFKVSLGYPFFVDHPSFTATVAIVNSVMISFMSISGLIWQESSVTLKELITFSKASSSHSLGLPEDESMLADDTRYAEIHQKLNSLMKDDKYYLVRGVSLESTAVRLGTTPSNVNRYLKAAFRCSFQEYIEFMRVRHAKILMETHPEYALVIIAEESGFVNMKSFNACFAKLEGMRPKEWYKENIEC